MIVCRALAAAFLVLPLLAPSTTHAGASPQADPQGVWTGAIATPGQALDVIVTLRSADDGAWAGSIDIPAQNLAAFPLSDVTVADQSVRFVMSGIPGEPLFAGVWDAETATISGEFTQAGASYDFSLSRTGDAPADGGAAAVATESAARVVGSWHGTLSTGAGPLRLTFHLRHENGVLTGTLDSPDQGQTGLPISRIALDDATLRLDLDYAGAYFEGTLGDDDATLDGTWHQGGGSAPLTLQKQ